MKTIHLAPRTLWRAEGEGAVVLDEVSGEPYLVDAVGAAVLEALRAGPTLAALVEAMAARFDGEPAAIEEDLEGFLHELLHRKLIEVREG